MSARRAPSRPLRRVGHMLSQAQPDQRKPGWDTARGTVTAVDLVGFTCTVTVRGVSIPGLSYIVEPSVNDIVFIQVCGTQYLVIGPIQGA